MVSLTVLALAAASCVLKPEPLPLHECWLCHETAETRRVMTADMGEIHICLNCGDE
jgi:hypothetical protein